MMNNINYINLHNNGEFIRQCPCSPGQLRCNYFVISPGIGCPYNCSYCFLKAYSEDDNIIIYSNSDEMFKEFVSYADSKKNELLRIGSGEFMDSLVLPTLDDINMEFVRLLKERPWVVFEFKTKSTRIENFLNIEPLENIVLSWSLNPQWIIEKEELGTPSLNSRLKAAQKAAQHGYKLALHLDPIFMSKNTLNDYLNLIETVFEFIPATSIAWFSMGGFRYIEGLKIAIMENNPKGKWYLFDEYVKCKDGKFRYPRYTRLEFYNEIGNKIKSFRKEIRLYLCMEDTELWKGISWGNCNIMEQLHPCSCLNSD